MSTLWKAVRKHSPQANGYRAVAVVLRATPFLSATVGIGVERFRTLEKIYRAEYAELRKLIALKNEKKTN